MLLLRMYTAIANAPYATSSRRHVTHYNHKVQPRGWTNKISLLTRFFRLINSVFNCFISPPIIVYGRWWFSPDKITDCLRFCTDFPPIFAHGGCLCTINSLSDRLLTQGWPNSHISLSCLSVWGVLHRNTTVNPKKCDLLTQKLSVEVIIVAQNLTMCHFLISVSPIICYLCFTSQILIAELLINLFLPKH